jgi:hypothetical protein
MRELRGGGAESWPPEGALREGWDHRDADDG